MTVCGLLRLDGVDVRRSALTGMLASSSTGLPAARHVHLDGPFGVVAAATTADGQVPSVAVHRSGLVVVVEAGSRPLSAAAGGRRPGGRVVPLRLAGRGGLRPVDSWSPPEDAAPARGDGPRQEERLIQDDGAWSGPDQAGRQLSVAAALARDYLALVPPALAALGDHLLAVVWEPARRRVVVSRGGRLAEELLMWSDGRFFAFGIEPAQVLAAWSAWSGSAGRRPANGPQGPGLGGSSSRRIGLARVSRLRAGETIPVAVTAVPQPAARPLVLRPVVSRPAGPADRGGFPDQRRAGEPDGQPT